MIWSQNVRRILDILLQAGRIDTNEMENTAILRRTDGCEEALSYTLVETLDAEGLIAGPYTFPYRSYSATDKAHRLMRKRR